MTWLLLSISIENFNFSMNLERKNFQWKSTDPRIKKDRQKNELRRTEKFLTEN